jgi:hypothetical protein
VERSWYQRSKHIFPASRWEVYDPDKDYGAYVSRTSTFEDAFSTIDDLDTRRKSEDRRVEHEREYATYTSHKHVIIDRLLSICASPTLINDRASYVVYLSCPPAHQSDLNLINNVRTYPRLPDSSSFTFASSFYLL